MKVLLAGGAGFIGSTVASALLDAGHEVIVVDNFVTGRREFCVGRPVYEGDVGDRSLVDRIFAEHPDVSAAVHCAALVVVPDSVIRPVHYYRENVSKTLEFVDALVANGCHRLIFSSSASIYEPAGDFSVDESSPIKPLSPYAQTKVVVEQMLADVAAATPLRALSLRYFNPIGADPQLRSGLQTASPSHALGKLIEARELGAPFQVTGDDYPTRDGSGIRDYVHVWDLASAHLAALERFDDVFAQVDGENFVINLGTGTGTTVFELVRAFDEVTGEKLPVERAPRRPGDSAGAYTRSTRAQNLLGWTPRHSLAAGIADSLQWFAVRDRVLN